MLRPKTPHRGALMALALVLAVGATVAQQPILEVYHRVKPLDGGPPELLTVVAPGPGVGYDYPFEYVVHCVGAGAWASLHVRAEISAVDVPAGSGYDVAGLHATYPWIAPTSRPLSDLWPGAVANGSATTLGVGFGDVQRVFDAAVFGVGSSLPFEDQVRPIYQPILWDGANPLLRTWDASCESWTSFGVSPGQPDPKTQVWKHALIADGEDNSTSLDPRSLFDLCIARQAGSWSAAKEFLEDPVYGAGAIIGGSVTVTVVSQVLAVANTSTMTPALYDNSTLGLFMEPPSASDLLIGLSPISAFRFHIGLPSSGGEAGSGISVGGVSYPVGPIATVISGGQVRLDLPISHGAPPMTLDVEVDGVSATVPVTMPRPGWARVVLGSDAQGRDVDVLSIGTPVGVSATPSWTGMGMPQQSPMQQLYPGQ